MGRFTGKVAIITGSSSGIGRETAKLFAQEGAKVTITGRNAKTLQDTKIIIVSVGGCENNVLSIIGDITTDETQKKLVEKTVNKFGKVDILVNNAGALGPDQEKNTGIDASLEVFDYTMNMNLRSVISLTKLALPYLIESKGEVVNISSIGGLPFSNLYGPYYATAKAALDQIGRNMAVEYIKRGVRVNTVNPGFITTAFMEKPGYSSEEAKMFYDQASTDRAKIPIGRVGAPSDIAKTIAFLADRSQSEFIVGQNIVVDGGSVLMNPILSIP